MKKTQDLILEHLGLLKESANTDYLKGQAEKVLASYGLDSANQASGVLIHALRYYMSIIDENGAHERSSDIMDMLDDLYVSPSENYDNDVTAKEINKYKKDALAAIKKNGIGSRKAIESLLILSVAHKVQDKNYIEKETKIILKALDKLTG